MKEITNLTIYTDQRIYVEFKDPELIKRLLNNRELQKELYATHLRDNASQIIEEILEGIESNKVPLLIDASFLPVRE